MSQLLLVKLVVEAVRHKPELNAVADDMLSQHRFGRSYIPSKLIQPIKQLVASFVKLQSKAQDRDPNIDFSNFFKRDDLSRDAFRKCCGPQAIKRMSTLLVGHVSRVG